jgi:hypothetical protein
MHLVCYAQALQSSLRDSHDNKEKNGGCGNPVPGLKAGATIILSLQDGRHDNSNRNREAARTQAIPRA